MESVLLHHAQGKQALQQISSYTHCRVQNCKRSEKLAHLGSVVILAFPANEVVVPQAGCCLIGWVMSLGCICLVGFEV